MNWTCLRHDTSLESFRATREGTPRLLTSHTHRIPHMRVSHVFAQGRNDETTSTYIFFQFVSVYNISLQSTYLFTSPSYSSKFVICKSSSPISPSLWKGPPTWAPVRWFGYDDLSEVCSVWTSTVTVARAVTRVTVELDESESTGGVLLFWFARLFPRLLLLWGPLLRRGRLPPEAEESSSCLVTIHNSESVGGVLCLHVELGRNSLFDPVDEAVPGGVISSNFRTK